MKKPIYKQYAIRYNFISMGVISATSKKEVMDYIKRTYVNYYNNDNGVISTEFYKLKNFKIEAL